MGDDWLMSAVNWIKSFWSKLKMAVSSTQEPIQTEEKRELVLEYLGKRRACQFNEESSNASYIWRKEVWRSKLEGGSPIEQSENFVAEASVDGERNNKAIIQYQKRLKCRLLVTNRHQRDHIRSCKSQDGQARHQLLNMSRRYGHSSHHELRPFVLLQMHLRSFVAVESRSFLPEMPDVQVKHQEKEDCSSQKH